jgi:hypothetical protein
MTSALNQRKVVRVLFDETHSESWTIDRGQAARINPDYPENSSYASAAEVLSNRDFLLARHTHGALDSAALVQADMVAVLHPCDSRWEKTTPDTSPRFAASEIAALQDFVRDGGALLIVTEYEHAKYGDNLNELLAPFGLEILSTTVIDRARCLHTNPAWVVGSAAADFPVLGHRVDRACFYQSGACRVVPAEGAEARIAWHASPQASPSGAGLIGVSRYGKGRVAVVTDSLLFGDEFFGELEHCALWLNICYWLAVPAFARSGVRVLQSAPAQSAPWLALKEQVNRLRELQLPDGAIADDAARAQAAPLCGEILDSLAGLRPAFGHQGDYFDQLDLDLRGWLDTGFPKPNFSRSLAAFTPEKHRAAGLESLVLFPLYTPNNSLHTKFEAMILRVPWPGWLDQLEATIYRNDKFVPGHLVDFTKGYDSECAVLFPETVSVAGGKGANHFGVIFCDREAARLQSYTQRAASIVGLALHPQLECFLAGLPIIRDTTALWDLIHDRSHSLGELPFDPFMIRQRAPFWMYSLEELRVDLRTFYEAGRLAKEGFPFAHYVSYAILFDRIFRFPVVGTRVKNYDGLGGQLLFSYLHQKEALVWCDNHLTVNWELLPMTVNGLREEIQALYRRGADCSKVSFWLDAHDLIAAYVKPNVASRWKRDSREITDEADPKKWIALVHDDEFPLGNFHVNLQKKLAQATG